jgi:isorenieratene synthase
LVVERSNLIGGKVNSHRDGGHSLEHGVHGWWVNYLNFDQLLASAGIDPGAALVEAQGSHMIMPTGTRYLLRPLTGSMPSPLFLLLQFLRAPYLNIGDVISVSRLAVHALAFSHEHDYARYDEFSFQGLLDFCGVSSRVQQLIFEAFILSFEFTTSERVSAACGLSGLQFYVIPDQRAILARWARGLPAEKIFLPIGDDLRSRGVTISLSTSLDRVQIAAGAVAGVNLSTATISATSVTSPVPPPIVVATVDAAAVPSSGFTQVATSAGTSVWVGRQAGAYLALSARCTHMGCVVAWTPEQDSFICPCHGGQFDRQGKVMKGPPQAPLDSFQCQPAGNTVQILGPPPLPSLQCSDVVLATDLESAKTVVAQTPGLDTELRHNMGHLDTTPVIVVRIWFSSDVELHPDIESAVTPGFKVVDNFFHLNSFDAAIAPEGHVIEVQCYRPGPLLDADEETVLAAALSDLQIIDPSYTRAKVTFFTVNYHRALFTRYGPGQAQFRPEEESATSGLHLAGDWTHAPWSVWMQERAVVSGIRAANSVLRRRGLPEAPIVRLQAEGPLLRFSRLLALVLRITFFRSLPMSGPPTPDALSAHLERDHHINGWVLLVFSICTFLPLFSGQFSRLLLVWPFPTIAVSIYFFFHTEPDVKFQYGSWLRSWTDGPTLQHRIMALGTAVASCAELALIWWQPSSLVLRAIFPLGLIGGGIIFYSHHHGDKALINRQHQIMAFTFIAAGLTWLGARFVPMFAPLNYAWPLLIGILAFLFISYTERDQTAVGGSPTDGHDGHSH